VLENIISKISSMRWVLPCPRKTSSSSNYKISSKKYIKTKHSVNDYLNKIIMIN
jgi:hypothetical protein